MNRRSEGIAILLAAALSVSLFGLVLTSTIAQGHPGHTEKKIFASRWYQQVSGGDYASWMNLSTSEFLWTDCDGDISACDAKWVPPANEAGNDWNAQQTTVRIVGYTGLDLEYDLNIFVEDEVFGDPSLFGVAFAYDVNYNPCALSSSSCIIWYGHVVIGDDAHSGAFGTTAVRRSTIVHEMGHLFGLKHESVNADESTIYDCGQDNTGSIPPSIMSYDCIDPVAVGGSGITAIQAWDACGVNHAYSDPTIGYAECLSLTATPSPTTSPSPTHTESPAPTKSPTPTPTSSPITTLTESSSPAPTPTPTSTPTSSPIPSQRVTQTPLGSSSLSPTQTATPQPTAAPSPTDVTVIRYWSDSDCDGSLTTRDNQAILRVVLSQAELSQTQPCLRLGGLSTYQGFGVLRWGDADCDGELSSRDNQAVLRKVLSQAALPQTEPCPDVGVAVATS